MKTGAAALCPRHRSTGGRFGGVGGGGSILGDAGAGVWSSGWEMSPLSPSLLRLEVKSLPPGSASITPPNNPFFGVLTQKAERRAQLCTVPLSPACPQAGSWGVVLNPAAAGHIAATSSSRSPALPPPPVPTPALFPVCPQCVPNCRCTPCSSPVPPAPKTGDESMRKRAASILRGSTVPFNSSQPLPSNVFSSPKRRFSGPKMSGFVFCCLFI